jgi:hypothetical protein
VLGTPEYLGIFLKGYKVIINKNKVTVSTADKVIGAIAINHSGAYDLMINHEYLK